MRRIAAIAVLLLLASALVPSGTADEGAAAERAAQRCVLFELFTAVNNTNCADDENATARLAQDFARSRLAILEWFVAGDPLACPESQERFLYYAITTPPIAEVDGQRTTSGTNNESQTYSTYRNAFATAMNQTPSADLIGEITMNGTNGTVNATISFTELTVNSGLALYCFLYEDGVHFAGTSNISYHKYVVRKQVGKALLTRALYQVGENTTASFRFTLQNNWNRDNTGVVLALQSDVTKAVHQSVILPLGGGSPTYSVEMSPPEQSLDLFSGRSTEVTVQSKNNGTGTDTIDFSLTGPAASWGSLSKASASLSPGEQTSLTVSINVPADTAPGGYLFKVRGTSRSDKAKWAEATVNINVQMEAVYGVSLSLPTAAQDVIAGDSATFQINVKNTGTFGDTVDLTVTGSQASWASLSRTYVSLPPNGEDAVTLTVTVPADTASGRHDFTVKGVSRGDTSKTSTAQATVKVTGQSQESYGVDIQPKLLNRGIAPGASATIILAVNNTGTATDTYDLSMTGDASGWAVLHPLSLELGSGAQGQVEVRINVPTGTGTDRYSLTVRATSRGDTTKRSESIINLDVQVPELPPQILSVSRNPAEPNSKEVVTVTAVVSGSSIDHVDITYTAGPEPQVVQKMDRAGNTCTFTMGPFNGDITVKYWVTAYSASGKSNISNVYSFTVKPAPATEQPAPGFGLLALAGALGASAAAGLRRARKR